MLSVRKFFLSKLRSSFPKEGGSGKENMNGSAVSTVVSEEYRQAFRTKSYTEICDKFQSQLEVDARSIALVDGGVKSSPSSPSSSQSPSPPLPSPPMKEHMHIHLSEYLVKPSQETLVSTSESSSKYHHFLTNYFDISLEATKICEFILQKVHQTRVDYHSVRSVIEFVERKPDHKSWSHNQHNCLYRNLASFSRHTNPFSTMTPQKFHELHDTHKRLLHELTSKCAKTKKRKGLLIMKWALAIVGCGAFGFALLLLAMYSTVGMVVASGLIIVFSLVILEMKKLKREKQKAKRKEQEGVDVAAKGIYVMMKDLEMMRRVVQNLRDEMEHRKVAAEVCVKKGKNKAVKEVAREFQMHECGFVGELEELEKLIYLCFLDINRSRRLLLQELDR